MKQINFITTLTPQQQYEIRRWCIISSLITITILIAIICYFAPQLYALHIIKKEIATLKMKTKEYATLSNTKNTLKKEHDVLQEKIQRINNYIVTPKNPHTYITSIIHACKPTKLESIRSNENDIELIVLCPSTESATTATQTLSDTNLFDNVKISSLQYDNKNNQLRCTVKISIVSQNKFSK